MKYNYPIRYAVRPIIEQTGWSHGLNELEREYGTVAYIVSKCYVVSFTKNYLQNGEEKERYNVVFPFQGDSSSYDCYYRVTPEFNLYSQCINFEAVSKVFLNYQEAVVEAEALNKKIIKNKISSMAYTSNFGEKIARVKEEQKEKLESYRYLEKLSEEKTPDMVVGAWVKEQRVIVVSDKKMKFSNRSLYEFIKFLPRQDFFAFNISKEEYSQMKAAALAESDFDCSNFEEKLLLETVVSDEIVKIRDYNNSREKGCFYIHDDFMRYDSEMEVPKRVAREDDKIKIYTMETYEEVINSYIADFLHDPELLTCKDEVKVLEKRSLRKKDFKDND